METVYNLVENADPSMNIQNFRGEIDKKNNAAITWDWPTNRTVKLMLVYEWSDEKEDIPTIEQLLAIKHPLKIVTRDLPGPFTTGILSGRRKFLICPGYFDESKPATVSVYKPSYTTGWLYKRTAITAKVFYKAVPLGQYQRVSFKITVPDENLIPVLCDALTYSICESKGILHEYPIDASCMDGTSQLYIRKDQSIIFNLDKNYNHMLELS